ncbi:E3 ubiquitin-protein ligase SH3RF3 isoform X2 [Spodoptera frugiperda]|uniref:RING-type E3 ubiquitin transferase n=1 Tax=Spodoptera frugiperda TaxID=7108 RepID=A0A9R0DRH3_SPOFR|nr:E3 ubiquitin-protein ligase SH3RF3 isoform X1 [Spodoptera frugiperda]XP_050552027.1 E3 ubiquitin-protein ligase SH3RF3 isoform X2 [Spodoptera frugiperda]
MDEGLLNDLLECSVCLERLDTSSRVLPCQHTFCLKCLKVIIESHKELRCPECRVLVEAKVEELPPNVLLMRILEGMKNSAPRKSATGQRTSRSGHSQALQGVQGGGKQLPPHARAIYDYISKEPGDLSFKKGETILIHKKLDTFWYQGECSGRTGMFPLAYVQVVVPLPVATALCKALYDFRMSAPDEEGCLAFDKGAIITVHRRVDDNWAEGRLDQRVGIFPIAFVELNQAARQLMNSVPLNRPVPPIPEQARPSHSDHRHHAQQQHSHRYQAMSLSTPAAVHSAYQNVPAMSQSQPSYLPHSPHSQHSQPLTHHVARNIVEPAHTKHSLDLIQFTNVHNKSHQGTMGIQSVSRIGENYDRLRTVKYDSYNSTPVHKVDNTYQNVRTHEHFPVAVANFNTSNLSSDSSSSMNTPSFGVSSTTTPNTSSDTSTCESAEPSLPSSPDNNTERNATVIAGNTAQIQNQNQNLPEEETNNDESLNTSMGVLSLNESSTATNTSLNVSLPPSESPKLNASGTSNASQTQEDNQEGAINNESSRLDVPSSSKNPLRTNVDALLNFGLGLQAALSPSHGKDGNYMLNRAHRDHHHRERDKRHSLTPSTHLQGNHNTQNRHSAEILATSLLDAGPENRSERSERRRRRSRSNERPLPAAYVAIYPYKPQKPDELELKKGGIYTVTERCRDGWYKGCSERSQRCGVFPGNYVAPASNLRTKHDKSQSAPPPSTVGPASSGPASSGPASTGPAAPSGSAPQTAPDAPPRARDPALLMAQPLTYPWNSPAQSQQSTPRSEKPKEKSKAEKSSISTGVSLMKRLAAMKKCKSPPPTGYSMDNPVFEDGPGTSLMLNTNSQHHPVHVRSGSCPSQLLRALPPAARTHKERPTPAPLHEHHHHLHRLYANTNTHPSHLTHAHTRSVPLRRPCTNITTICTGCMQIQTLIPHTSHMHTQGASHSGAPARTLPPSAPVVCKYTHTSLTPHARTHKERPIPAPLHEHHHHLHRTGTENPWQSQHRKSQSLDVTASRRDRHHTQPNKERFRCIVPYPPNSEYELELKVDDIVIVSKKRGDGWYKGTLQRTGRTGLFPASFVQSCPPE